MNGDLLKILKETIAKYGGDTLADSRRVSAVLADMARDVPRPQKTALVKSLEHRFAQYLKNASKPERENCKRELAQRLHLEEGLDLTLCRETLELLAAAVFAGEAAPVPENAPPDSLFCACGAQLPGGSKFCNGCGTPVPPARNADMKTPPLFCATCGAQPPEGSRFCNECGTPAREVRVQRPPASDASAHAPDYRPARKTRSAEDRGSDAGVLPTHGATTASKKPRSRAAAWFDAFAVVGFVFLVGPWLRFAAMYAWWDAASLLLGNLMMVLWFLFPILGIVTGVMCVRRKPKTSALYTAFPIVGLVWFFSFLIQHLPREFVLFGVGSWLWLLQPVTLLWSIIAIILYKEETKNAKPQAGVPDGEPPWRQTP